MGQEFSRNMIHTKQLNCCCENIEIYNGQIPTVMEQFDIQFSLSIAHIVIVCHARQTKIHIPSQRKVHGILRKICIFDLLILEFCMNLMFVGEYSMESNHQNQISAQNDTSSKQIHQNWSNTRVKIPYSIITPTFDPFLVGSFFKPAKNVSVFDKQLETAINERLKSLVPTPGELADLTYTASKLMVVLDRLRLNPEQIDSCKIENFCIVGSARLGTVMKGSRTVDVLVVLQTLPAKASLAALANKLLEEFQRIEPINDFQINVCEAHLEITETSKKDRIKLLIATNLMNFDKMDKNIHIPKKLAIWHLNSVSHLKWFEHQAEILPALVMNDIKNLIRIIKDLCNRFQEFALISPWMVIVLSHYSILHTRNGDPLPIHIAFKRILQLLSSGLFLPYSSGICDPIDPKMPIHGRINVFDQEKITRRAQTLLRALNQKMGIRYIFGFETNNSSEWDKEFAEEVLTYDNIVFRQNVSVFDDDKPGPISDANSDPVKSSILGDDLDDADEEVDQFDVMLAHEDLTISDYFETAKMKTPPSSPLSSPSPGKEEEQDQSDEKFETSNPSEPLPLSPQSATSVLDEPSITISPEKKRKNHEESYDNYVFPTTGCESELTASPNSTIVSETSSSLNTVLDRSIENNINIAVQYSPELKKNLHEDLNSFADHLSR